MLESISRQLFRLVSMKKSLSELIKQDLELLSDVMSEAVVSEESIRLMLDVYNKDGLLHHARLIHRDQLFDYLVTSGLLETPGHYQFMIEIGARSKSRQYNPDTIHYCALDLYITSDHPPIILVADHYRGFAGYYDEFDRISLTLGISFLVTGMRASQDKLLYQADNTHCAIFSLYHLLLTAADDGLQAFLMSEADGEKEKIDLSWSKFPIAYVLNAQSVTTLSQYASDIRESEGLPAYMKSDILQELDFESKIMSSLYPLQVGPEIKMRNLAILKACVAYSERTISQLPIYSEEELIDLCYREQYPNLSSLLMMGLGISSSYDMPHPLFELSFYHAGILESFLKDTLFSSIFRNQHLLTLMQMSLLDPMALFLEMTHCPKDRELIPSVCKTIAKNIGVLQTIYRIAITTTLLDESKILALLRSLKTSAFFEDKILVDLFRKGLIPFDQINKIIKFHLVKTPFYKYDTDAERIACLNATFSLSIPIPSTEPAEFALSLEVITFDCDGRSVLTTPMTMLSSSISPESTGPISFCDSRARFFYGKSALSEDARDMRCCSDFSLASISPPAGSPAAASSSPESMALDAHPRRFSISEAGAGIGYTELLSFALFGSDNPPQGMVFETVEDTEDTEDSLAAPN